MAQLAVIKKDEVMQVIDKRVNELRRKGFSFPKNYNYQNALASAWLKLIEIRDRNGKPVLETCNKASVYNALFDMLVQGLNPIKNQCYFVAYGSTLTCQRSYLGAMLLAKRVTPEIEDIRAQVVYQGDEFETEYLNGKVVVTKHKQGFGNIDSKQIVGAYCCIVDKNDKVIKTEIMSAEEIKEAWNKSQMHPIMQNGEVKKESTHWKFMTEMARKTVINRACKSIINASDDTDLIESVSRSEVIEAEQSMSREIQYNNDEVVDIEEAEVITPEKKPAEEKEETNAPF